MAMTNDIRSVPELFGDLINQLTSLVRGEIQLAKTEMSEKFASVLSSMGLVIGGAVLMIAALVIVLEAVVDWLVVAGLQAQWSSTIVGVVGLAIGAVLMWVAMNNLKAQSLTPNRTVDQLQRDAAVAREQVR